MLNRRILRVKAMQALYSYFLAEESQKAVVREQLESSLAIDPAKDDFAQAAEFKERQKLALRFYDEFVDLGKYESQSSAEDQVNNAVANAISQFRKELKQEVDHIRHAMMKDVDDLYKMYLQLVSLAVEFAHIERLEKEKKEKAFIPKELPWKYNLMESPIVDALTKFEAFNKALISEKVSWSNHLDHLRSWYRDILLKDEYFQEFEKLTSPSLEDHKGALVHLFKKIIFKDEVIGEFLSELDIRWSENKPILKSLVVKTFQDYEADLEYPFELKAVSRNEEEDLDFFKRLFEETIKREKELDLIIASKTKNWDIERVALIDRIILKMALTEMILFHSIPVKVTINEFIEISKEYSTPKSKQFINGILDVLANQLSSEGTIRKSGRGLIDNK
jgi:N utilization substance protein B